MEKSASLSRNTNSSATGINNSKSVFRQQSLKRLGLCSQIATAGGQHSSPIVFPEKRSKKVKASSKPDDPFEKSKVQEHRIDIIGGVGDEKSDLLGCVVFSGKLILDKRKTIFHDKDAQEQSSIDLSKQEALDAKLTSKALILGSHIFHLDDVISVMRNNFIFAALLSHGCFSPNYA